MKLKKKMSLIGLTLGATAMFGAVFLTACGAGANEDITKNMVRPSTGVIDGKAHYLKYEMKDADGNDITTGDKYYNQKIQTLDEVSKEAVKSPDAIKQMISSTVSSVLTDWFKNIKGSKIYSDKWDKWVKDINKEWDDLVKRYKKDYGDNWDKKLQWQELDPVGGAVTDWKRKKIFSKVNSEFDSRVKETDYIRLADGFDKGDLRKPEVVNGVGGEGNPNQIIFAPEKQDASAIDSSFDKGFANLQEFIFDKFVREELPIITSMTLFKHEAPLNTDPSSDYFNIPRLKEKGITVENTPAYKWQVFYPEKSLNPEETPAWNATKKYNEFVKEYTNNKDRMIVDTLKGAVEIDKKFTDDSATLFLIKRNSVFDEAFLPYAASSMYKFYNEIFGVTDNNVPTATTFGKGLTGNESGTEIMSNFMSTSAKTGYFNIPEPIQEIMNDNGQAFKGKYNGVVAIADTVNLIGSPFILTRDEAGVHIIGIDRLAALTGAKASKGYEGVIQEIKNTLLWRHMLTKEGKNTYTGFSIDLKSMIDSYYDKNRDQLLYEYLKDSSTKTASEEEKASYLFSDKFSQMTIKEKYTNEYGQAPIDLIDEVSKKLFDAYFKYDDYQAISKIDQTIKTKMIDVQAPYLGKIYGNTLIDNGIAGLLPYTRSTDPNTVDAATHVIDQKYGEYDSLSYRSMAKASDAPSDAAALKFSEKTLEDYKKELETAATDYLTTLNGRAETKIGIKNLPYISGKWTQYLFAGNATIYADDYYESSGVKVNNAISSYVSSGKIKDRALAQKTLASVQSTFFDKDQMQFAESTGAFSAAVTPTDNNTAVDYIKSGLQYVYDQKTKLPKVNSEKELYNNGLWTTYSDLVKLADQKWKEEMFKDELSSTNLDFYKSLLTLQYALNFEKPENSQDYIFTFKRFRDYLLDITKADKKASFVWVAKDRRDLITGLGTNKDTDFAFKKNIPSLSKDVNGYAYQGAVPLTRDATTKMFNNETTMTTDPNYWNYIPYDKDSSKGAVGFMGIQTSGSSTIDSAIKQAIFSDNINVSIGNADQYEAKGTLYHFGGPTKGKQRLLDSIDSITNNFQINNFCKWLREQFPEINDDALKAVYDAPDLAEAKKALQNYINDPNTGGKILTDKQFEGLAGDQIIDSTKILNDRPWDLKFFASTENDQAVSQAIVTQFNHNDVVELFDTNSDNKITDEDIGINWNVAKTKGFLNTSFEAFISAAYEWSLGKTYYANIAYKEMKEYQGKLSTYDRRLNDSFGEEWVTDFKKRT